MKAFRTKTRGKYHLANPDNANQTICGLPRKWATQYDVEREATSPDVCKSCIKVNALIASNAYVRRQTTRDEDGKYSKIYMCDKCGLNPAEYADDDGSEVCEICAVTLP